MKVCLKTFPKAKSNDKSLNPYALNGEPSIAIKFKSNFLSGSKRDLGSKHRALPVSTRNFNSWMSQMA